VNLPPVVAWTTNDTFNEGSLLSFFTGTSANDIPANTTLTFTLDPGAPVGAHVDGASGAFTWTPTEAQGPSNYVITVRVTDNGQPPLSDTKTFNVAVHEVNLAPVLAPISNKAVTNGGTLTFTASATDADLPTNTLSF